MISYSFTVSYQYFRIQVLYFRNNQIYYVYIAAGNYSSLIVFFRLEREAGHYIMDYYVPSILIVAVSWVTFWLDPNAVPGRTTLGMLRNEIQYCGSVIQKYKFLRYGYRNKYNANLYYIIEKYG